MATQDELKKQASETHTPTYEHTICRYFRQVHPGAHVYYVTGLAENIRLHNTMFLRAIAAQYGVQI